jgi:hypothetical protein
MSNDVPTKAGYYRDFEGDIWRLEEEGVNNWTLRPGQPTEKRNAGDFWCYQPMYEIPAPAGLPEVEYQVEVTEDDRAIHVFSGDTLPKAQEYVERYVYEDAEYRILRVETTEVAS